MSADTTQGRPTFMPYPPTFIADYSYTGFAVGLGDGSFPGSQIDNDLLNISAAIAGMSGFIKAAFRSDGILYEAAIPGGTELVNAAAEAAASATAAASSAGSAEGYASAAQHAADVAQAIAGPVDTTMLLTKAGNLNGIIDTTQARANLGLGGLATMNTVDLGLGALATLSTVDYAHLASDILDKLLPTGAFQIFMRATAPSGWVKVGTTIGGVGSGSDRAAADALSLYTLLWTDFSDTTAPMLTSSGGVSLRGTTAINDWDVGKRLTVPDLRGEFLRVLDDGRGVDTSRVIGSAQAEMIGPHGHNASSSFTGTPVSPHTHTLTAYASQGSSTTYVDGTGTGSTVSRTTSAAGGFTPGGTIVTTVADNSGTENRVRNVALLGCVKL